MKVALVHDYLTQIAGGERVLQAWSEIWPQAQIYTSVYDSQKLGSWLGIDESRIHTNFISNLPFSKSLRRHYTPLYPLAFLTQRIESADVILSSSAFAAKFVHTRKDALNIAYIHTPPKFLYDLDRDKKEESQEGLDKYLGLIYKNVTLPIKFWLRAQDRKSLRKVDYVVCNSEYIKGLVAKIYSRNGLVIYPPVDTQSFTINNTAVDRDYFLVVSRLDAYKKVDIVIKAFNKLEKKLKVVGSGPAEFYLKSLAKPNIEFLGSIPDTKLADLYKGCLAVIFPTKEDLGIVPLEAQASGRAVIAFGQGGARETIIEGKTGLFFDEQTPEAIIKVMEKFNQDQFSESDCRQQAEKFSEEEFKRKFRLFVEEAYFQWNK